MEKNLSGKNEFLFKVLVVGNSAVGKTSLVRRYVHNTFTQHYQSTIGVDFALKVLHHDENTLVRIQLWDISGNERYGNMTKVYYRDAVGALVVFDVTRTSTLEAVEMWKNDLDAKAMLENGMKIPVLLLGNKVDQYKDVKNNMHQQLDKFCASKGFAAWYTTSAKNNTNVEEAMTFLVQRMLSNCNLRQASREDKETVDLNNEQSQNQRRFKLCCS